jgi:hypothetical protein
MPIDCKQHGFNVALLFGGNGLLGACFTALVGINFLGKNVHTMSAFELISQSFRAAKTL